MRLELKERTTGKRLFFNNNKEIIKFLEINYNVKIQNKDIRKAMLKYLNSNYIFLFIENTLQEINQMKNK